MRIVGIFLEKMYLGILQVLHTSHAKSGVIRMIHVTQLVQEVHLFHAGDSKFVTS